MNTSKSFAYENIEASMLSISVFFKRKLEYYKKNNLFQKFHFINFQLFFIQTILNNQIYEINIIIPEILFFEISKV